MPSFKPVVHIDTNIFQTLQNPVGAVPLASSTEASGDAHAMVRAVLAGPEYEDYVHAWAAGLARGRRWCQSVLHTASAFDGMCLEQFVVQEQPDATAEHATARACDSH